MGVALALVAARRRRAGAAWLRALDVVLLNLCLIAVGGELALRLELQAGALSARLRPLK